MLGPSAARPRTADAGSPRRSPRLRLALAALALALAVLWTYAPVGQHDFVRYDDDVYLLDNPHVARGLEPAEMAWAFREPYAANYHPLTWLAHMLDVQLFGLDPGAHHRVSAALHALNAALFLVFLHALGLGLGPALLGAAGWALHPLRVESVAWASERKEVLCATFFLLGLLAYAWHARRPGPGRYAALCGAFALALLAKPSAVVFPLVALLLDAWSPEGWSARTPRRRRLETLPLLALAALSCALTLWAQGRGGSTSSLAELELPVRLLNAVRSVGVYLLQSVAPHDLSIFYPHAALTEAEPLRALLGPAALAGVSVALVGALAWRTRSRAPGVLLGLGVFLVALVPVLGLVQVGTQAHADRYTYLPALGLGIAMAALVRRADPRVLAATSLALALVLAGLTRRQLAHWRDTRSLFEHALAVDARNPVAHQKLGELARSAGDPQAAAESFRHALELDPRYVEALIGLGLALRDQGHLAQAAQPLERAHVLAPDDTVVRLDLGVVELELGELERARAHFEAVLAADPRARDALLDLGILEQRAGNPARAEARFLELLACVPGDLDGLSHLGEVRLAGGRAAEALEPFEEATRRAPADATCWFNLGLARRAAGAPTDARAAFERALELDPELEPARRALLDSGGER